MKKIINKTTMAVILALTMVLALVGGLLFAKHSNVADAAGEPTTIEITADTQSFFAGGTFKLTIKVNSSRTDMYLNSLTLNIGPKADAYSFDTEKAKILTFSNFTLDERMNGYNHVVPNRILATPTATGGQISISEGNTTKQTVVVSDLIFTVDVAIASTASTGTEFEIGIKESPQNSLIYINQSFLNSSRITDTVPSGQMSVTPLKFTIEEPSDNNNLDTPLKVGQGDDASKLTEFTTVTETGMAVTVTDPSLPLSVLPIAEDGGAKIKLLPGDVEVKSGEIGKVAIPANGTVTIEVTAENGDKKTYTIQVTVKGAALTALVVTPDSTTAGVTKKGLDLTATSNVFDPAAEAYKVYVPSDSTKVDVTATVTTGNSASNQMNIAKTGSWTAASSATSGTLFSLTDIKDKIADNDTLTIECKDTDNNVTKSYVLTFDVVDVDTSVELKVVGSAHGKTFESSSTKASENNVNYYYMVIGETNASSSVTITASGNATLTLNSTAYTSGTAKTLTANTYTINVEAEAGNTAEYKFILRNYVALELKDNVVADFLYEEEKVEYGETVHYRKSYKQDSLTHGIDDIDFTRLVIGQISNYTCVNDFLDNFKDTSKIKLYTVEDELVFDLGAAAVDYPEDLDDADYYCVATGWYLEYVVDGKVEETIYVSVLGDLDSDGMFGGEDMAEIGKYIRGVADYLTVEFRLAGYINNTAGTMEAEDIALLSSFIRDEDTNDNYFYKKS